MSNAEASVGFAQALGRRESQQDSYWIMGFRQDHARDPKQPILLIVADGMGGHAGGQEASTLAVKSFTTTFDSAYENRKSTQTALNRALEAANAAIAKRVDEDSSLQGMGCTISAVLYDDRAYWVSVGDSPVWVVRQRLDGQMQTHRIDRVNRDHSLRATLERQADMGLITREQAESDRRRNQLRSALVGGALNLEDAESVDRTGGYDLVLEPGERIVIASDGIETLSNDEIAAIAGHEDLTCQQAADTLLSKVMEAGHPYQDNTTVIVFQAAPPKPKKAMSLKRRGSDEDTRAVDTSGEETVMRPVSSTEETVLRPGAIRSSWEGPTQEMKTSQSRGSNARRPSKAANTAGINFLASVVVFILVIAVAMIVMSVLFPKGVSGSTTPGAPAAHNTTSSAQGAQSSSEEPAAAGEDPEADASTEPSPSVTIETEDPGSSNAGPDAAPPPSR